jgi:hypothetical protein
MVRSGDIVSPRTLRRLAVVTPVWRHELRLEGFRAAACVAWLS